VGSVSGGLGVGLIMVKLLESLELPAFAARRMRVAAVRRLANRSKAPGRPEGLPHTATMTKSRKYTSATKQER
jgi:hypothetical protein